LREIGASTRPAFDRINLLKVIRMKFEPTESIPKPRESLGSILAFAFVIFWLFGMIVGALIMTCHYHDVPL
jgi:hypothetical protein